MGKYAHCSHKKYHYWLIKDKGEWLITRAKGIDDRGITITRGGAEVLSRWKQITS